MQALPSICSPDESVSSKRCKLHRASGPSGGDLSSRNVPSPGPQAGASRSSKALAAAESAPQHSGDTGAAKGDAGPAAQPQQDPSHKADAYKRPAGSKGGLAEAPSLPVEAGDPPRPERWPAKRLRTRSARQKQSSHQQGPAGGQYGGSDTPAAPPRSATGGQAESLPSDPGHASSPDAGASEDNGAPALGGNGSIKPSMAGLPLRALHPDHQELAGLVAPFERQQARPGSAMQPDAGDAPAAAAAVERGARQHTCLAPGPPSAECGHLTPAHAWEHVPAAESSSNAAHMDKCWCQGQHIVGTPG